MNKILKSRTVWTVLVMFFVNGLAGISDLIPANLLPLVNAVLSILAIYFKVTPSQKY